jgi:cytochrome c556
MISKPDYSSADEAEYQQFIQTMIEKCQEATQAVKDQDFPKFEEALNVIDKTCGECHVAYRNG